MEGWKLVRGGLDERLVGGGMDGSWGEEREGMGRGYV